MATILAYREADTDIRTEDLYDFSPAWTPTVCTYCSSRMDASDGLSVCPHCGWWVEGLGLKGFGVGDCRWNSGKLKTYDVSSLEVPLLELRKYLSRHPHDVAALNPFKFEKLIASCLRDSHAGCEVTHVGGTRDRGIDLLLVRSTGETSIVQVKRRCDIASTEGVDVVRQLNGVLFREGATKGMVVTTAAKFSTEARREALVRTPTREAYEMKLLAYPDLIDLFQLQPTEPYEPWKAFR